MQPPQTAFNAEDAKGAEETSATPASSAFKSCSPGSLRLGYRRPRRDRRQILREDGQPACLERKGAPIQVLPLASVPKGAAGRGAPAGERATGVPAHRSAPGDQARALPGAAPIRAGVGGNSPTGARLPAPSAHRRSPKLRPQTLLCGTPVPRADESPPGAARGPRGLSSCIKPDGPKSRRQRHWDKEGLRVAGYPLGDMAPPDDRNSARRAAADRWAFISLLEMWREAPAESAAYRSARSRFRAMASLR